VWTIREWSSIAHVTPTLNLYTTFEKRTHAEDGLNIGRNIHILIIIL